MFKKYDRLPKTVEAVQFTEANKDRVFNLLTGQYAADFEYGKPVLKVTTIHGEAAIVRLGDWIIKEPKLGHYYPIKDDIFREGYEGVKHMDKTTKFVAPQNIPAVRRLIEAMDDFFSYGVQLPAGMAVKLASAYSEFKAQSYTESIGRDVVTKIAKRSGVILSDALVARVIEHYSNEINFNALGFRASHIESAIGRVMNEVSAQDPAPKDNKENTNE